MNSKISIIAAIAIGIVQYLFVSYYWGYIAIYIPLIPWVIGLETSETVQSLIFHSFDFVVNVLLSLPAAYAIYKLQPRKLLLYITLAVVPSFIWINSLLISEPSRITDFGPWYIFLPGWIHGLVSIPIAVLIVHLLTIRLNRTAV